MSVLTFSNPKNLSLPSGRTGLFRSCARSFSRAVGTGAFGSFFAGGCTAVLVVYCREVLSARQSLCRQSHLLSPLPKSSVAGQCRLTEPGLNFPKNDMFPSSCFYQTTNAPRARRGRCCPLQGEALGVVCQCKIAVLVSYFCTSYRGSSVARASE